MRLMEMKRKPHAEDQDRPAQQMNETLREVFVKKFVL
jgi:hypothetical protein